MYHAWQARWPFLDRHRTIYFTAEKNKHSRLKAALVMVEAVAHTMVPILDGNSEHNPQA